MPLHFCFEMTLWFNIILSNDPHFYQTRVLRLYWLVKTLNAEWTLCWMESTQQSLRMCCSKMPLLFNEPCFNVFAFLMPYLKRPGFEVTVLWDTTIFVWCIEGLECWYWSEAQELKNNLSIYGALALSLAGLWRHWLKTLCWMESTWQSLRTRCSKMPLLFNEPYF